MRRKVPVIPEDALVRDAVLKMIEEDTDGLVVVSKEDSGKMVGFISSTDILEAVVPDYLEGAKSLASFEAEDVFLRQVKAISHHPIEKWIKKEVRSVYINDTLIKAATILTEYKIHQLPVLDSARNVVGYITRVDVRRAFGDSFREDF